MTSIDQGIPEVMCFRCGKIWTDGGEGRCPHCNSRRINPAYVELQDEEMDAADCVVPDGAIDTLLWYEDEEEDDEDEDEYNW